MKALIATLMLLTISPALAAERVVYPTESSSKSAPAAPDKSLGSAIMSAVIDYNGALVRGSGAVSSIRIGTGAYKVTFDRPILECVMSLTAANINPGGSATTVYYQGFYLVNEPNTFQVLSYGQTGNAYTDAPFHVLVFCGK